MKAFWEILRPFNCMMAASQPSSVWPSPAAWNLKLIALIFFAVFLITGAGNAINDYYDREIDAINRPKRPIPSGRILPGAAFRYSLALFAAGCILAGLVNQICLFVAAFNSILLFFYARNLKATPLAGNISVAFLTGSTFLFGGAAAGAAGLVANQVPFGLSFLASMSREIAKDIEDMAGDRQGGARTLPILAGERAVCGPGGGLCPGGGGLELLCALWQGVSGDSGGGGSVPFALCAEDCQRRCGRISEGDKKRNGSGAGGFSGGGAIALSFS